MNAKKIMGAVLVALLAVTAFAGVAAAEETNLGTVFIYQNTSGIPTGVWQNGEATVTVDTGAGQPVIPSDNFVAGTYKQGDKTIYVTKPTAAYSAYAVLDGVKYIVPNGGKVYAGSNLVLSVAPLNSSFTNVNYYVTFANGTAVNMTSGDATAGFTNARDGSWNVTNVKGDYKVQAFFNDSASLSKFYNAVPFGILLDESAFTFTIVDVDDMTISAAVDTAYSGETVKFTIAGAPGKLVTFNLTGFNISLDQKYQIGETTSPSGNYTIKIDNGGNAEFVATVNSTLLDPEADKIAIFKVVDGNKFDKDYEIKIKISKPVVTGTVGAASYFLGDNIVITGTSTLEVSATNTKFNISGINYPAKQINTLEADCEYGKTWKIVIPTETSAAGLVKKLDVGTYTISMIQGGEIVATFTVNLKQPFISIISAPEVITQNTEVEFLINAEASTTGIKAYVFGTNYYKELTEIDQDEDLKNQFTITMSEGLTAKMDAGQYFMVLQHPMYNGEFNIGAYGSKFYLNTSGPVNTDTKNMTFLFDADSRQTANAAQALCDALETQNIDDLYIKYSFFVVGQDESFSISEIPTTVAQGETITISGVDTANAGETIQVTMLSTAFAAVPKEDSNSAAFILVTTEIAEDGTWEVTLDTSSLAIDEYNLAVKIQGEEADKKNVRVNVVEAGDEPVTPPTDEPGDEPSDEPVAPETPGFGALAALAGLGAVAVLLLRRE